MGGSRLRGGGPATPPATASAWDHPGSPVHQQVARASACHGHAERASAPGPRHSRCRPPGGLWSRRRLSPAPCTPALPVPREPVSADTEGRRRDGFPAGGGPPAPWGWSPRMRSPTGCFGARWVHGEQNPVTVSGRWHRRPAAAPVPRPAAACDAGTQGRDRASLTPRPTAQPWAEAQRGGGQDRAGAWTLSPRRRRPPRGPRTACGPGATPGSRRRPTAASPSTGHGTDEPGPDLCSAGSRGCGPTG